MTRRVVVVGGDATGMSAASGVKRALGDQVEVTVLEKGNWTSYAACGIPYWLAGEVNEVESLVARSPEQHRANGIDVRTGTEALALDLAAGTVSTASETFPYDDLVLATGATPIRPDLPGAHLPGVHGVQNLDEGRAVLDSLKGQPSKAVVVGSGYIGLEMAEAMKRRGLAVTVLEAAEHPMRSLDPEMGELVGKAFTRIGITFRGDSKVVGFDEGPGGRVSAVRTETSTYPADLVITGLGVRPNNALFTDLPTGDRGGLLTDEYQRVEGHQNIYAGGDCTEVVNRITGRRMYAALGTHANKHGRVIASSITGGDLTFPGVVGTALTKVFDLEIGRVGLREARAAELGFDAVSVVIKASTRAHYYPGATPIHVKMLAERGTGRVIGCQIVGGPGSAKRIDAAAVAIWNEMTAEGIAGLDLAYAPPFSPVWDPVQTAARVLAAQI